MKELEDSVTKLHKAVGLLAGQAGASAAHHQELHKRHLDKAEHHEALSKIHKAHHDFVKAKHDSMDDDDTNKAYFGKAAEVHKAKAEHHDALAKTHEEFAAVHKGQAEDYDNLYKAMQGIGFEPGNAGVVGEGGVTVPDGTGVAGKASGGVVDMINATTAGLVKKSLEMLNTDSTIQDEIRKMVLEGVRTALSDKTVPDHVRGVLPGMPAAGRPIPRAGSAPVADVSGIDPELQGIIGNLQ